MEDSLQQPNSEDEHSSNHGMYVKRREELLTDIRSMSDEFDKSILTLSSGGLGLSLAFLKDIVPFRQAHYSSLLYSSWAAFLVAIAITVFSYALSIEALKCALTDAEGYYLHGQEECLHKRNLYAQIVDIFRWVSGISFLIAILLTSLFVAFNVKIGSKLMSDSDKSIQQPQENRGRSLMPAAENPTFIKGRTPMPTTPVPDVTTGRIPLETVPKPASTSPVPVPSSPGEKK